MNNIPNIPNPPNGGKHYQVGSVQPFDLTRNMKSSGFAHVDSCRCNVIKYAFRLKGAAGNEIPKLIDDLEKAAIYANEAVAFLKTKLAEKGQADLPFAEWPEFKPTFDNPIPTMPLHPSQNPNFDPMSGTCTVCKQGPGNPWGGNRSCVCGATAKPLASVTMDCGKVPDSH